jgi:hypothetical protein
VEETGTVTSGQVGRTRGIKMLTSLSKQLIFFPCPTLAKPKWKQEVKGVGLMQSQPANLLEHQAQFRGVKGKAREANSTYSTVSDSKQAISSTSISIFLNLKTLTSTVLSTEDKAWKWSFKNLVVQMGVKKRSVQGTLQRGTEIWDGLWRTGGKRAGSAFLHNSRVSLSKVQISHP